MTNSNTPATPAEIEETYRVITWRLIPFLIICYLSAYVDRSNIGIAKLQFTRDIGLSEAMFGLGGGIFYLGYSLLEVPSNLVMERIGARRTIARVMFLWSLISAATAFISTPVHFFILRFLLGAAEAGFFPGVLFYLSQWVPAKRRAGFTALFMSSLALSGVISSPISGLLLHSADGAFGLHGWQWLFLIEGLPGCVLAIIAFYYLTDRPAEAKWLTPRQKAIVAADMDAETTSKSGKSHGAFKDALKDKRFYLLVGMAVALISGIAGLTLWVPSIIQRSGVKDVLQIGLLSAIPYVCGVIAQQLIARSSDKRQERIWHAAIPAGLAALGWFALPFAKDSPQMSLVLLVIIGIGIFGATGPFWATPANYLRGRAAAGGIALITTCGSISAFFSPILVGWATDVTGALALGQVYYGGILTIGVILLLILGKSEQSDRRAAAGEAGAVKTA